MKQIKLYIVILLFTTGACKVLGHELSKQDIVLYILFDSGKNRKFESKAISPETLEDRWEDHYSFANSDFRKSRLYDGYPLEFLSVDKRKARVISVKELKKLPIVTVEQLHKFISENYRGNEDLGYFGRSYFRNLKHIYIVEKNEESRTASVTEVKIDIIM